MQKHHLLLVAGTLAVLLMVVALPCTARVLYVSPVTDFRGRVRKGASGRRWRPPPQATRYGLVWRVSRADNPQG
ncbi:MAG: hypothetical protein ACUVTY_01480 [Armatimonadota bacterium]